MGWFEDGKATVECPACGGDLDIGYYFTYTYMFHDSFYLGKCRSCRKAAMERSIVTMIYIVAMVLAILPIPGFFLMVSIFSSQIAVIINMICCCVYLIALVVALIKILKFLPRSKFLQERISGKLLDANI